MLKAFIATSRGRTAHLQQKPSQNIHTGSLQRVGFQKGLERILDPNKEKKQNPNQYKKTDEYSKTMLKTKNINETAKNSNIKSETPINNQND